MIKVRMGRNNQESLRPLTEKEIQKKLYGAYAESVQLEEERVEPKRFDSRKPKEKKKIAWRKLLAPAGKIVSFAWKAVKGVGKIPVRWGVGFFSVVLVFLAIHALNAYRTEAMRFPRVAPAAPPAASLLEPVVNEAREEIDLPSLPLKPATSKPVDPPPPQAKQTVSPQPLPKKKPYAIQVATYATQRDAQRLAEQMRGAGFSAFIQSSNRPNGKTFYLVFLGRFATFQEAEAKFKEFHRNPLAKDFKDSFIRML